MKILVFGTFDGLHPGHQFFLVEAGKRGNLHVVVARDENVLYIKNKKPENDENERVEAIRGKFPEVDVRLGDSDDYLKPVRDIKPDLIVLGYDQRMPPGVSERDLGCEVERLPKLETNN